MNKNLFKLVKRICENPDGLILVWDNEQNFDWGIPELTRDGVRLVARNGDTIDGQPEYFYKWDEISIVAHYGFVAKTIKESDVNEFKRIKIAKLQLKDLEDIKKDMKERLPKKRRFGDPLEIDGVYSIVDSGLFVEQRYGAEAVIFPQTELIMV